MAPHARDDYDQHTLERIARIEAAFERFVSDAESEKRTRRVMIAELKEVADRLDERLRRAERLIWIGVGGLAAVQMLIKFVWK